MRSIAASTVIAVVAIVVIACGDVRQPSAPPEATAPMAASRTADLGLIAFVSSVAGEPEIYVIDSDGGGLTNLSIRTKLRDPEVPTFDKDPAWSPDGACLAFFSDRDGDAGIYVMDRDGLEAFRIIGSSGPGNLPEYAPAWSPDGRAIAYVSGQDVSADGSYVASIYVADASGANPVRITEPPNHQGPVANADDTTPAWSPDGKQIAFTSNRAGKGSYDIYVMESDGSGLTNLTNHGSVPKEEGRQLGAESIVAAWPGWSPDGSRIAFASNRDGNWEIYVINADGSNLANLTNSPEQDGAGGVTWSPNGLFVAFTRSSAVNGAQQLWVMNADGSDASRLAEHLIDVTNPAWSPLPGTGTCSEKLPGKSTSLP